jgi:Secretion system C-terminal sorting domain
MLKKHLLLLTLFVLLPVSFSSAQLFLENFDYPVGDSLINHGWTNHSGSGTQLVVEAGSLTYTGYPNSGVGNSTIIAGGSGSREDIHADFTPTADGSLYVAMLVNVSTATTTGDYFFHLAPAFSTTFFKPRLFVKDDGAGNLQFGITKAQAAAVVYTTTPYLYNTTYVLVLKYEMPAGDSNDVGSLYINPPLDMEPGSADLVTTDLVADDTIATVCLRQGGQAYTVQIDGITIGTSWNEVVPVELTSFTANIRNGNVVLNWSTATEVNNSGFEIQRKSGNEFEAIGFVSGRGTTTETQHYFYTDNNVTNGTYTYRLKQVDFDGSYAFSEEVNLDVNSPVKFELGQNYPNPFNPSTKISFSIPQNSQVTLDIYNLLGQKVKTLVQGFMQAGKHTINFDASGFNSGIYFYKIQAGSFSEVRKMTLLK